LLKFTIEKNMFVKSLSCPWLSSSTIDKFFHFDE